MEESYGYLAEEAQQSQHQHQHQHQQQQQPSESSHQQPQHQQQQEPEAEEAEEEMMGDGIFSNVSQGLTGNYRNMMMAYWQETINSIEHDDHDFKNHQLPLARIKKVMKTDEEVRMISAEAPILFAKGCDIFITELTMRAWIHAEESKRRTLQKSDIAAALQKSDMFDFLIDIVPRDDDKSNATKRNGGGSSSRQNSMNYGSLPTTSSGPTTTTSTSNTSSGLSNSIPNASQQNSLSIQDQNNETTTNTNTTTTTTVSSSNGDEFTPIPSVSTHVFNNGTTTHDSYDQDHQSNEYKYNDLNYENRY